MRSRTSQNVMILASRTEDLYLNLIIAGNLVLSGILNAGPNFISIRLKAGPLSSLVLKIVLRIFGDNTCIVGNTSNSIINRENQPIILRFRSHRKVFH